MKFAFQVPVILTLYTCQGELFSFILTPRFAKGFFSAQRASSKVLFLIYVIRLSIINIFKARIGSKNLRLRTF